MRPSFTARLLARLLTAFAMLVAPLQAHSYTMDTTFTPAANVTGLWWIPSESGWGATLTQQGSIIFVTIFTYDSANNPIWYVASHCEISGDRCTDALYRVRGGAPLTRPFSSASVTQTSVGTVSLVFSDVNNGVMTFTIDGVSGSKQITRMLWGQPALPPEGALPPARYSDVFQAVMQLEAQGGRQRRTVSVRNTASSGSGCYFYDGPPKDRQALENLVQNAGGTINRSTETEWCARIGNESICMRLVGGAVLAIENQIGSVVYTDVYMPGLASDRVSTVRLDSSEGFARLASEWPSASAGPTTSTCPSQPAQSRTQIDGNWSGYSLNYAPGSGVTALAPNTMTCTNQTCTIPGAGGATFSLSATTLWRTATGAPRLAGAAVSDDSQLASVFVCNGATVVETQPFQNCTFFSFKRQ